MVAGDSPNTVIIRSDSTSYKAHYKEDRWLHIVHANRFQGPERIYGIIYRNRMYYEGC